LDDARIADPEATLARAVRAGLEGCVVAGVDPLETSALRALSAWPQVGVTLGLHPWVAARCVDLAGVRRRLDALEALLEQIPVVGLGECGLDRSRLAPATPFELQELAFKEQLASARARNLPVVLHVIKAHEEVLQVLRRDGLPQRGGMVHSFAGSLELAEQYLSLGLVLSFSASILTAGRRSQRAVASLPADCFLVETDAPDQCPNDRKPALNEPAFLVDVIAAIAALRCCEAVEIEALTAANARRLFLGNG